MSGGGVVVAGSSVDPYFTQSRPDVLAALEKVWSRDPEWQARLREASPEKPLRILDIGCGAGYFGAALKSKLSSAGASVRVEGVEISSIAATEARARLDDVTCASVETFLERAVGMSKGEGCDLLVFNDVLEHLVDPETALKQFIAIYKPMRVWISLPNLRYWPVLRDLVFSRDFEYADFGVLDRTHLHFYTRKSMARMLASCGLKVRETFPLGGLPRWKFALLNVATLGLISDSRPIQWGSWGAIPKEIVST
jgi:SAM-dependent methyltransferase